MKTEDLEGMVAPFKAVSRHSGRRVTVIGFSRNDPLGVGGGMFPSFPTVYFGNGGWLLLEDFLENYDLFKGPSMA